MSRFSVSTLPHLALVLALLAGCGSDAPSAVPAAPLPPVSAVTVAERAAPAPNYWVSPPEPTFPPVPRGPVPPEVVDAYLADCSHVFPATGEDDSLFGVDLLDESLDEALARANEPGESPLGPSVVVKGPDECTWREFHQNCSPDAAGCWEKGEACALRANAPCLACQKSCSATCESCKATCGTKTSCLRACAEKRGECRNGCMAAKATWQETTCADARGACAQRATDAVKAECGGCTELLACLRGPPVPLDQGDARGDCEKRHPLVTETCWSVCYQALWMGHLKVPSP